MAFNFLHYACEISLFCFIISCMFSTGTPIIDSVSVINETQITDKNVSSVMIFLQLDGSGLDQNLQIRPIADYDNVVNECTKNYILPEFTIEWSNKTCSVVSIVFGEPLPSANKFKLCVLDLSDDININKTSPKWLIQNSDAVFRTRWLSDSEHEDNPSHQGTNQGRFRREDANLRSRLKLQLYGVRLEFSEPPASYEDDGSSEPTLLVGSQATYRLFGTGWANNIGFVLTEVNGTAGSQCKRITGDETKIIETLNETATSVQLMLKMPKPQNNENSAILYFCYFEENENTSDRQYLHLGTDMRIKVRERVIPLWLQIVIICVCLSFSSLFSGLNLGLLSLNKTDLRIISNTGTETEKRYAKAIYPVRVHGNYLLCSILLGNVLVNSIFTILLDDLSSGLFAVVVSTFCIVICGEICPQAVCSRHGLAIGAKTIYITKTVMAITAPLAWPLSTLLDWILGEEIATAYTRERLKELIVLTTEFNDLERDEVNIISGALELRRKTVGEVMTKIEDVYMLSYDTILDFETVSEIMKSGFSRIPVYEGTRRNIVSLLYIKDLALVDPDDCTPLKTLSQFYQNSCYYVFEDTTLDIVFKQFKEGAKGHMAFVHRVNNEGDGDPFYETVGIVTLEDVIEELIQAEIMDETDVYTDNRSKQRRAERMHRNADFSMFAERNENQRVHISPQLHLAAFQFLSSSVDAFKPENVSEGVLTRLLKQDVIFHIKMKDKEKMKDDSSCIIYQQGKPADYFVLILEGRVQVTIGRENLLFENGPFTYFGSQSLIPNIGVAESPTNAVQQSMGSLQSVNLESMMRYTFIPDYTVKAVSEVFYLRIKRSMYLGAKKATLMEKSKKVPNTGEQFDEEVERLLHNFGGSGGEEDAKSQVSHDGSFVHPQNIQFTENSSPSTPIQPENINNGFIASGVSPSRTPHLIEQNEENTTLLGSQGGQGDRNTRSS